jgi:hypothetical protein
MRDARCAASVAARRVLGATAIVYTVRMLRRDDQELTQSWLDGALAQFAADNDDLVLQTRSVLHRVVPEAPQHARMINTLSLLEHMGSHKIMATQHSPDIDQATLKHLAEEAHHAYFMKRQAEKTADRPMDYVPADLLAPAAARMYFQRLESRMVRTLVRQRSSRAVYLYMSMVVEFRALWFYGLYQQTLQRARHPLSLKRVIGEEQNHLGDIANRLDMSGELSDARAADFLAYEKDLYRRFLSSLQRAVA